MTRPRRALGVVAAIVAVAIGWVAPAGADGDRVGPATVIAPGGGALGHGGSSTPFTLELTEGASCPGDSANEDYRLQSFVVPDGVDPAGLTYESTKPAGEGNWALYEVNSNPYVQGLTAQAPQPGDPGVIDGLPTFDFAVFPPGTLVEGVNRIGIACTLFNETVQYWDTEVVLTDDAEDEPAQLTWEAVGNPEGSSSSNLLPWAGLGVAALAVAGGVVLVSRRRRPAVSSAGEP